MTLAADTSAAAHAAVAEALSSRTLSGRTVRRLMAADGYLQLGLPAAALAELDRVEGAGPLQSARDYLAGQALMADDRHEDALEPLARAAEAIPAPWNRAAYESLSECFRATGQDDLAEVTDLWGDDDGVPPGFDPDDAASEQNDVDVMRYADNFDPAEAAAEAFEAGPSPAEDTAWNDAEDFGDAADHTAPGLAGPALWGGDGWGGEGAPSAEFGPLLDDPSETGDFGAEADEMEPGRPRDWEPFTFDGGFGTDDEDTDALPPHSR
jgi:tetratricopeptide (TPR) repeat protein